MAKKHGFGRIPSPFDMRDYKLTAFMPKGILKDTGVIERQWEFPKDSLDQGETPHCVGFSMADFGICLPVFTDYDNEDGHKFYYLCKIEDGEPEKENGSYIRSAAKVLRDKEKIDAYAFATSIDDIKWWVLNRGPMIVGTLWTTDMLTPDSENLIHITGTVAGGHAYLITGWSKDDIITIQNSWGEEWGDNGKAYITKEEFQILFNYDGEAMTAVEVKKEKELPKKTFIQQIIEWIIQAFKC